MLLATELEWDNKPPDDDDGASATDADPPGRSKVAALIGKTNTSPSINQDYIPPTHQNGHKIDDR
jgi:hypothetical protein